ncbi:MAG: heparinase II/III-family protein, partial [Muribaculaceae bacterium]|nr:heparinase II/III-family protein [Muribaculaceae bacterium]
MNYPMGLLYLPDVRNAPKLPDLPTAHLWKDFGWATMRDSWKKDATMLAVKSGMTWNHSHADANSCILFHKGVDIIKDAGNCSYGKPEYRNYFFQSDAHNVVKFNGEGQPRAQQYHGSPLPGNVSSLLDAGDVKYVMANGTGPMSRWLSRNYRHYLWIGNEIYVVDDLVSHEPGQFEWLWHPGGEVKKRGGDLEITSGESSVVIRPLYPEPLAPSNFVHDYPNMLWWEVIDAPTESLDCTEQYWSLHLPKVTDRVKGVTAIILKDSPDQKTLPKMTRIEGKNWIGVRSVFNGKVTDLYINQLADGRLMHLNSWIEADGWTTDAYMLAVTYDEGKDPAKSSEVVIIHGGSLKRDDHIYHSSRSKVNVVGKVSDGKFKAITTDIPSKH